MSTKVKKYRYQLEGGSKKYICPGCGEKRFVRYIDQKKGDCLPEKYGRCDREINCGYFLDPYSDGYTEVNESSWYQTKAPSSKQVMPDYIPEKVLLASLRAYSNNNFVQYLKTLFSGNTVVEILKKYHVGSSKQWGGSTVFWQVDIRNNVRTGKVMKYLSNGHRKKADNFNYINWVHTLICGSENDFNLVQCLFGEHLLAKNKIKPVAIVESEKTAIISSVYFPEFIWLAAGSLNNLKAEMCKVLMGRSVTLFPDVGALGTWHKKAEEIDYFCNVSVSDLLELNADYKAKQEGYDLADYLTQFDINEFRTISNSSLLKSGSLED